MTPAQYARHLANLDNYVEGAQEAAENFLPLGIVQRLGGAAIMVDLLTAHAVEDARAAGYSWQDVADHLGVTRQAAQQRFSKPIPELLRLDR